MNIYAIHAKSCQKLRRTKFISAESDADLREIIGRQAGLCFACGHELDNSRAVLVCYQSKLMAKSR